MHAWILRAPVPWSDSPPRPAAFGNREPARSPGRAAISSAGARRRTPATLELEAEADAEAGSAAAEKVGELVAAHIIPRPHSDLGIFQAPDS